MPEELQRFEKLSSGDPSIAKKQSYVLIVEDDLCLKTVMERVLKSCGQEIGYFWATSVEEARSILESEKISLIVADFTLVGEFTGLELWKYCDVKYPQIPFLMMSGLGVNEFFDLIGTQKVSPPFLPKPFRVGECQQILKSLLRIA